MLTEKAQIISNQPCAEQFFALDLHSPGISAEIQPGQFLMIATANGTQPFLKRPMAVNLIVRNSGRIRVIYQVKGEGTQLLSQAKAGDYLEILGPLGQGWRITEAQHVLLVGGGVGVAPLLPLATELSRRGVAVDAMLGARSAGQLFCVEDFQEVAYTRVSTNDGSSGDKGLISQFLSEQPLYDMVYTCGRMIMMQKIAKWAEEHSLPCQVSLEEHMGCGFGVCMGCVCKIKESTAGDEEAHYQRICTCGPVFDSREVVFNG